MQAVLFDVDGTLLNTYEFIAGAYEHVAKSIGRPLERATTDTYMSTGKGLCETYAAIFPGEDIEMLAERHREFQINNFDLATPYKNAHDVLGILRTRGYKLAAVTNRSRASALATLKQTGLLELLDAHICPEDTPRPKPDPEHILTALRAIGTTTEDSWMVGDTFVDIEAAHAAGVRSIGISHSGSEEIRKYRPTRVVFSLPEILPILFGEKILFDAPQ